MIFRVFLLNFFIISGEISCGDSLPVLSWLDTIDDVVKGNDFVQLFENINSPV